MAPESPVPMASFHHTTTMQIVRVYDPSRHPKNWTEIIRPGQFVAFSQHVESAASCDADGNTAASAEAVTCVIFNSLREAAAFCRERVEHAPMVRFDVFDSAGRTESPLLTIVNASHIGTLEGNRRAARLRTWSAVALLAAAPVLSWYDWAKHDGLLILPTVLAVNFVVIAARLFQLNAAHAAAERSRRERLAQHGDHGEL